MIISYYFFFSFFFLGPHLRHMGVPRLGVKSELQLLVYATATAMWDPSRICDLHPHGYKLGSLPLCHRGNSLFSLSSQVKQEAMHFVCRRWTFSIGGQILPEKCRDSVLPAEERNVSH